MKSLRMLLVPVLAIAMIGCSGFINTTMKTLSVSGTLADGAMKTYAADWKYRTNQPGADLAALLTERSNIMVLSRKVGAGLAFAHKTVDDYQNNVGGTNAPTSAIVSAIVQTAVSDVGSFASTVTFITGKTNFFSSFENLNL